MTEECLEEKEFRKEFRSRRELEKSGGGGDSREKDINTTPTKGLLIQLAVVINLVIGIEEI